MLKIFRVADIRPLTDQWLREEISYSRMVELMNEIATEKFKEFNESKRDK